MDPNETLRKLRDLALEACRVQHEGEIIEASDAEWSELFLALNSWLSKGGFLPKAWERKGT